MSDLVALVPRLVAQHYACGEVSSIVANPGSGFSGAELFRVHTTAGVYALRSWEASGEQRKRLEASLAVIRHAAAQGCESFLSVPISTRRRAWIAEDAGRLWQLSRWLDGQPDFNRAPSLERLQAVLLALARFHQATGRLRKRLGGCNAIPCRLVECRAVANYLDLLREPIQRESNPELQQVAWELWQRVSFRSPGLFERGQPLGRLEFTIRPILGDVWHDNLIFADSGFSGFVDYTAIQDDAVSVDLARLLGSLRLGGETPWEAGLAAYQSVSPLSLEEQKIIPWLHESGLVLGGLNWLKWIFVHRREFSRPAAVLQRMRELSRLLLELASAEAGTLGGANWLGRAVWLGGDS